MPQIFYLEQKKFEIPDDITDQFLTDNPGAIKGINYSLDDKSYNIPETLQQDFLNDNPGAILADQPPVLEGQKSDITYDDPELNQINQQINSRVDSYFKMPDYPEQPEPALVSEQPQYSLRAAPEVEPTIYNRFKSTVKDVLQKALFAKTTTAQNVEGQLQYAISQEYNLPLEYVRKNYDELIRNPEVTGVSSDPTLVEGVHLGFQGAVTVGVLTNPIATALGVGAFMALDEAENAIISKVQGDPYVFGAGKNISDLLPEEATRTSKEIVEILDLIGKGAIIGGGRKLSKTAWEKIAKEYVTEYNFSPNVYISPSKAKAILVTGDKTKFSKAEAELLAELGVDKNLYKRALKEGISIEVPTEKVVRLVDKPWWAKAKGIFGIEKSSEIVKVGEPRVSDVRGLLPEKAKTAAEVEGVAGRTVRVQAEKPTIKPEKPVEVKPTEPKVEKPVEVKPKPKAVEPVVEPVKTPVGEPTSTISKDEARIVKQLASPDPLPKGEKLLTGKEILKYDWISKAEQAGEFDRLSSMIKRSRIKNLKDEQAKFLLDVYEAEQLTGNRQGEVNILFDQARDKGIITEAEGQAVSNLMNQGKKPTKKLLGEGVKPENIDAYLADLKKRYSEPEAKDLTRAKITPEGEKATAVGVKAEKTAALNEQYNAALAAQEAAQAALLDDTLPGARLASYEKSFERSTKLIEDLEKQAQTDKLELEKVRPETDAIKEVVSMFEKLDPEVDYQVNLKKTRTLQEALEDPKDPATPESVAQALQDAGQDFVGIEPAEVTISGQNYQAVKDGALVDTIKIHQGANIGTVLHERGEMWYRQQERLYPENFDKKITEERNKYHERTGEKDDPSQSNREWFSDRVVDNAIGDKPTGKFGAALQRIINKFWKYAQGLRKSASRFAKFVKQGKVPKELKSFLDRSISEKLKTAGEIKTMKEGTSVKTGVPNYELILKKKARTHTELKKIIPESQRVVVKKGKNEPYPHVSGSKFKDLPALEKTESNVTVTQSDINKAYNDALKSAGIDPARLPADMEPMGADFWNDALSLPDQVRYWYEISAEAFGERFVDMTPAEIQTALAVSSAASVQATPDLQISRTISILAQIAQKKPVTVGTPVPKTVSDALFKSLQGLKTGNFEQTFSYILGYVQEAPLSTNDRQVAAYFNISPDLLGSEGNLYEALSKFHINIRDVINKKLPEGVQPYESWQLQALPWVQMRRNKGVSLESNDLQQALDNALVKLENAGIDVPRNPAGDMIITNELLNNPKVIDVLSPTSKQFEQAKIATVEVGTTLNPEGKKAAKLHSSINKLREGVTDLKKLNSIDKALDEYDSIRRRNLGKLSRPNANLNKKSIVENLIQIITGKTSKVSRVEYGRGVGGTYEGVFSPNIRIPLVTKFAPKGSSALDNSQTTQLLAVLGDKLEQAAMAASSFTNAEPSKAPDTHSALIEHEGIIDSRDIEAIENMLNKESGLQFSLNVKKVPNGTVVDVNPHFNEDFTMAAPDKHILNSAVKTVLGDKIDIKLFDNTYSSNYIEQPEYINYIKDLENEISRREIEKLQSQIGGTKKRISQAVKGRKEVRDILEGFSKSNISRAEKARNRYRNDRNSFRATTKEIDRIASSVKRQDAQWEKTHSSKLPTYELKKLTPEQRKLRKQREKSETEQAKKPAKEKFEDLKSVDEKTSPLPKYARSINLDKQAISDQLKRFEVELGKLESKKTQTWDQTGKIRDEILSDYRKAIKVIKRAKKYGIVNAAEYDVIRQINVNAVHKLQEITKEGMDKDAIRAVQRYYDDIFKLTSDVSSEIGRALNIQKRIVAPQRMAKAFSEMERPMNDQELELFKKINFENPMEVERFLNRIGDPKLKDYFYEYWYNNILSGIPTHLVNIGSNTLWGTFQIPMRALQGGLDALIVKFTGKKRQIFASEVLPMLAGYRTGIPRGAKRGWETAKTGEPPLDIDTKWDIELGASTSAFERSPHPLVRKIAPGFTLATRALRTMDVWANSIAFDQQINALAERAARNKGLKGEAKKDFVLNLRENPTKKMIDDAKAFAKYSTFMDDPGKFTAQINSLRGTIPGLRIIIPFINTVANLTKRGIEMTPGVGLVQPGYQYLTETGKDKGKGFYTSQPAAEMYSKQIVGAIITLYMILKSDNDELIGKPPKNKSEREAFYRQNKKAYSIKYGDEWIQYRRIEPFNTVIASTAIAYDELTKEEDEAKGTEIFFRTAEGIVDNLLESSYMDGLSTLFNKYGKREQMVKRMAGSLVPYSGFWRSINRSWEVFTKGEAKYRPAETFLDAFAQVIPGLSDKTPAALNVWGEEVVLEGGVLRQWLPVKYSKETDSELEKELERIGVYPSLPNNKLTILGETIEMPKDFYRDYAISYGSELKKVLEARIKSSKNKDPEKAIKMISPIVDRIRDKFLLIAKSEYIKKYGKPSEK